MENYKIIDPIFVDLQKTVVRFTLVTEEGLSQVAEFKVPPNRETGVNKYWDRIVEEFDVEGMRKRRNDLEIRRSQEMEFQTKKNKANQDNAKLTRLFETKASVFEYFFIKEAPAEIKSSIRKAPDETVIQAIVSYQLQKYMEENSLTVSDIVDKLNE